MPMSTIFSVIGIARILPAACPVYLMEQAVYGKLPIALRFWASRCPCELTHQFDPLRLQRQRRGLPVGATTALDLTPGSHLLVPSNAAVRHLMASISSSSSIRALILWPPF